MDRKRAKWIFFGILGAGSILGVSTIWLSPEYVFDTLVFVIAFTLIFFTVAVVLLSPLTLLFRTIVSSMSRRFDYGP